jgi:leader peptidase (prepilin peptidase) / N-methyltransferase
MPYVAAALLGAIVGSFLNVVIYRLHTGRSLGGRSHCMSCGETLLWYELLPVVSYLSLRGRCNLCSSWIPIRYLIVEVLTALLFVLSWHVFGREPILLTLTLILMALLVVILVYDIRHTIIPNEFTLAVSTVALGVLSYEYWLTRDGSLVLMHLATGVAAAGFFFMLWFISKGRWIGFGDVKLVFPLGVILGGSAGFSMIVFSFWIGAGIALMLLAFEHFAGKGTTRLHFFGTPLTMKSEIPFAPFLIAGFLLTYLFHADTFSIISFFLPW